MANAFLTFKRFNDADAADDLVQHLKNFDIPYIIEDTDKFFDPTFARDPMQRDIFIKLHPQNFTIAQERLNEYYKEQIKYVQSDHYLFDFSDRELMDILAKPDEWGDFDNQLAQQILRDRGREMKKEQVDMLINKRKEELTTASPSGNDWILVGFISLFLGGFVGMFVGWHLYNSKKTLPDGSSIYMFKEADRKKGRLIFILGSILFLFTLLAFLYTQRHFPFAGRLRY